MPRLRWDNQAMGQAVCWERSDEEVWLCPTCAKGNALEAKQCAACQRRLSKQRPRWQDEDAEGAAPPPPSLAATTLARRLFEPRSSGRSERPVRAEPWRRLLTGPGVRNSERRIWYCAGAMFRLCGR